MKRFRNIRGIAIQGKLANHRQFPKRQRPGWLLLGSGRKLGRVVLNKS